MTTENPPREAQGLLDSRDHSRESAGKTYVYAVVSRRAGGVSIGINLNPNNACNWRCIYCQVPNLKRGNAPSIDLGQLENEFRALLTELQHGDFMTARVPVEARQIEDVAFSGNGEPTSAPEFLPAIDIVMRCMEEFRLLNRIKLRLITNGSLVDRPSVRKGIARLSQANGEVWFKLDAGSRKQVGLINSVDLDPLGILRRLKECAELCPTWVQTCCFSVDGLAPNETEILAWLDILNQAKERLAGVHLYGLARKSLQPEAPRLARLDQEWLEKLAARIRNLGLAVQISH